MARYAVYFVLPNAEEAIVVAVLHQSRAPLAWKKRVEIEGGGWLTRDSIGRAALAVELRYRRSIGRR
jgi:hypothetical protein